MQRLVVRPETALVRPFVTAAVLRGVTFDPARYASFIDLQDKLHANLCRQRSLVSMGTHDLATLQVRGSARAPVLASRSSSHACVMGLASNRRQAVRGTAALQGGSAVSPGSLYSGMPDFGLASGCPTGIISDLPAHMSTHLRELMINVWGE